MILKVTESASAEVAVSEATLSLAPGNILESSIGVIATSDCAGVSIVFSVLVSVVSWSLQAVIVANAKVKSPIEVNRIFFIINVA